MFDKVTIGWKFENRIQNLCLDTEYFYYTSDEFADFFLNSTVTCTRLGIIDLSGLNPSFFMKTCSSPAAWAAATYQHIYDSSSPQKLLSYLTCKNISSRSSFAHFHLKLLHFRHIFLEDGSVPLRLYDQRKQARSDNYGRCAEKNAFVLWLFIVIISWTGKNVNCSLPTPIVAHHGIPVALCMKSNACCTHPLGHQDPRPNSFRFDVGAARIISPISSGTAGASGATKSSLCWKRKSNGMNWNITRIWRHRNHDQITVKS